MSFRSNVTGWMLRPAVNFFGVLSRAGVPYSNKSMIKHLPCNRSQGPIILDFLSAEGKVAVHNWYKQQLPNTRFTSLEYRKDKKGTFKHEFIVVLLEGGLCRFDRRAREDLRGHALKKEGTMAEDSAQVLSSSEEGYTEIMEQSEVLLSMGIPDGEDLQLILAVCCGIQTHPHAASYSLLRYNCYFFSWTIVTAVARHASNWEQATTTEIWDSVVDASLEFISPIPRQPKLSRQRQIKSWFRNLGKTRELFLLNLNQDELSRAHFRDELQLQLRTFRSFVADTLRELLLPSQLAHRLGEQMRLHSTDALLRARATTAQGCAAVASMQHVSNARSKPMEPQKYGELTWKKHCDIAWEVASDAAYAAAIAEENSSRNDNEVGANGAGGNLLSWDREWDNIWDKHWRERIPSGSFTTNNRELGMSASRHGKEAWKEAWSSATELGNQHLSEVAENVTRILLKRLGDLEKSQVSSLQTCSSLAHLIVYNSAYPADWNPKLSEWCAVTNVYPKPHAEPFRVGGQVWFRQV